MLKNGKGSSFSVHPQALDLRVDPRLFLSKLRKGVSMLEHLVAYSNAVGSRKDVLDRGSDRRSNRSGVLFVASSNSRLSPIVRRVVRESALQANQPFITEKWPPGLLTNWEGVGRRHFVSVGDIESVVILDSQNHQEVIEEAKIRQVPCITLSHQSDYQPGAAPPISATSQSEWGSTLTREDPQVCTIPIGDPNSYKMVYFCMNAITKAATPSF